ncbi:MAG: GatB/YqeY domain-containing protein [Terracidiphilus sp.]
MTETATLEAQISQQIVAAMKAHDVERTGTLRLIKSALMNKAIEKRGTQKQIDAALTQAESEQVLATMIKQRRDSIEQFTNGGRPDLAAKEAAEIVVIEEFLPKALDEAGLAKLVAEALTELEVSLGHKPTVKDMGPSMKAVQAKIQATGVRAEGRLVSELVKKSLAG